jgi:hypothetical protein
MQRGDGGLRLVGAGSAVAHRLLDERETLGDHRAVPERAVLRLEEHDPAALVAFTITVTFMTSPPAPVDPSRVLVSESA